MRSSATVRILAIAIASAAVGGGTAAEGASPGGPGDLAVGSALNHFPTPLGPGFARLNVAAHSDASGLNPRGNVEAAIDSHARDVRTLLDSLERHRTPQARLKGLVRALTDQRELAAQYGCPLGSLCSELDKRTNGLDRTCAQLLELPIDWAETQFLQMGRRDARDLAVALMAAYQGIALLTNTFRDPELMTREARRMDRWIDSLV